MSKSSFLTTLLCEQRSKKFRLCRGNISPDLHSFESGKMKPRDSTATPMKGGVTVEHHEVEPEPKLDLAECTLFTAYGVNPELAAWFKQNCASTVHLSTKHEIYLEDDQEESNCVICQDTTAGCFVYITLPCCKQVIGDECLLSWFLGGEISNAKGTGLQHLASTTCPCCRADLLPKPVEEHVSWEDEEEERALAAIIAESRAWITDRPPPPTEDGSSRVKQSGKRKKRRILEALHLRRRASKRRARPVVQGEVLQGEDSDAMS